jgi:hypothetical protein
LIQGLTGIAMGCTSKAEEDLESDYPVIECDDTGVQVEGRDNSELQERMLMNRNRFQVIIPLERVTRNSVEWERLDINSFSELESEAKDKASIIKKEPSVERNDRRCKASESTEPIGDNFSIHTFLVQFKLTYDNSYQR